MSTDHQGGPTNTTPSGEELVTGLLRTDPAPTMPDDIFARLQAVVADEVRRRDETPDPAAWAREAKKKAMARFGNPEQHAVSDFDSKPTHPERVDHQN